MLQVIKRIRPDEVISAYRSTGIVATTCTIEAGSEIRACCGIGVMLHASGNHPGARNIEYGEVANILGLVSRDYVSGFTAGFDCGDRAYPHPPRGSVAEDKASEEFNAGLEDGQAAREAVFAENLWFENGKRESEYSKGQ